MMEVDDALAAVFRTRFAMKHHRRLRKGQGTKFILLMPAWHDLPSVHMYSTQLFKPISVTFMLWIGHSNVYTCRWGQVSSPLQASCFRPGRALHQEGTSQSAYLGQSHDNAIRFRCPNTPLCRTLPFPGLGCSSLQVDSCCSEPKGVSSFS